MDSAAVMVSPSETDGPLPQNQQNAAPMVADDYNSKRLSRQLQLQTLLEGYSLSNNAGYPVLSLSLPDGSRWSKLIWTRTTLPTCLYRWNTPEEVLSYLISFDHHKHWITGDVPTRPPSGTIKFYNKKKTKNFRDDGYDWKTRVSSKKTIREDRMKLKVRGQQLICATYSHSESNPLLHRRCYWFTQNPSFVLVHYLETDANSHKKTVLKKSQENGFEVTMEGTAPADYALLAISDDNICMYLAKGHDGEKPQPLLSTLSRYVWLMASQNLDDCFSALIKKLNEKLLVNMTPDTREQTTDNSPCSVPMLLVNQAMELLKLQAYSAQYGGLGLLPKGTGCLPPSVLLEAASLIIRNHMTATSPVAASFPPSLLFLASPPPPPPPPLHTVLVPPHQSQLGSTPPQGPGPSIAGGNQQQMQTEADRLYPIKPPSLESIRSFLPEPLEFDSSIPPASSSSTSHNSTTAPSSAPVNCTSQGVDFDMETFSRFAQNLRAMNPLKDCQNLNNRVTVSSNGVSLSPPVSSSSSTTVEIQSNSPSGSKDHSEVLAVENRQPLQCQESSSSSNSLTKSQQQKKTESANVPEMSELEKQAVSLLSADQISDLLRMDFELTNNGFHSPPSVEVNEGIHTMEQYNGNTITESFLDQFFTDSPAVPFNPDSLLQTPMVAVMGSNHTTGEELQQTVEDSPKTINGIDRDSFMDVQDSSQHLDIDSDTLAQLMANGCDSSVMVDPPSPTSQYIDSLIPSDDSLTNHEHSFGGANQSISDTDYLTSTTTACSNSSNTPVHHQNLHVNQVNAVSSLSGSIASECPLQLSTGISQLSPPSSDNGLGTSNNFVSHKDDFHQQFVDSLIQHTPVPTSLPTGNKQTQVTTVSPPLPPGYRTSSPLPSPSSPSIASVSPLSTMGADPYFDQADPPSVAELCEMLGESRVVQNSDFSHLSLSDSEQQELIKASLVIQNTMRKCMDHSNHGREKDAVLCIERSYKRYRELKRMREAAARRIQLQYRLYRRRTQELNRATLFIQQMYRYQKRKHHTHLHRQLPNQNSHPPK